MMTAALQCYNTLVNLLLEHSHHVEYNHLQIVLFGKKNSIFIVEFLQVFSHSFNLFRRFLQPNENA